MTELGELQHSMEATYGTRDRARGIPATVAWLAEEVGELAKAARKRGEKLASTARERGVELAESARQHGSQFADTALTHGSHLADTARERVGGQIKTRRRKRRPW